MNGYRQGYKPMVVILNQVNRRLADHFKGQKIAKLKLVDLVDAAKSGAVDAPPDLDGEYPENHQISCCYVDNFVRFFSLGIRDSPTHREIWGRGGLTEQAREASPKEPDVGNPAAVFQRFGFISELVSPDTSGGRAVYIDSV